MIFSLDIWSLIAFGVGFWILMDGLCLGLIPETMQRILQAMKAIPEDELRWAGLTSAAIGAVIVFFIIVAPRL